MSCCHCQCVSVAHCSKRIKHRIGCTLTRRELCDTFNGLSRFDSSCHYCHAIILPCLTISLDNLVLIKQTHEIKWICIFICKTHNEYNDNTISLLATMAAALAPNHTAGLESTIDFQRNSKRPLTPTTPCPFFENIYIANFSRNSWSKFWLDQHQICNYFFLIENDSQRPKPRQGFSSQYQRSYLDFAVWYS